MKKQKKSTKQKLSQRNPATKKGGKNFRKSGKNKKQFTKKHKQLIYVTVHSQNDCYNNDNKGNNTIKEINKIIKSKGTHVETKANPHI